MQIQTQDNTRLHQTGEKSEASDAIPFHPNQTESTRKVEKGSTSEGSPPLLADTIETANITITQRQIEKEPEFQVPTLCQELFADLKKISDTLALIESESLLVQKKALELEEGRKTLDTAIRNFKELKGNTPVDLALVAIDKRLPVLLKAYQATANGDSEAKSHFVQLCKTEIRSALLNQELTGEAFTQLKNTVKERFSASDSNKIALVLGKKTDPFIDLLKAAINEVKDETASPEAKSRLDRLYRVLQSYKTHLAIIAIYVCGQLEFEVYKHAPEITKHLLSVKLYLVPYLGVSLTVLLTSPVIPLLCFFASYLLSLAGQYAAKRSVDEDTKQSQQQAELLKMIYC